MRWPFCLPTTSVEASVCGGGRAQGACAESTELVCRVGHCPHGLEVARELARRLLQFGEVCMQCRIRFSLLFPALHLPGI
jgi:hypothetical protein